MSWNLRSTWRRSRNKLTRERVVFLHTMGQLFLRQKAKSLWRNEYNFFPSIQVTSINNFSKGKHAHTEFCNEWISSSQIIISGQSFLCVCAQIKARLEIECARRMCDYEALMEALLIKFGFKNTGRAFVCAQVERDIFNLARYYVRRWLTTWIMGVARARWRIYL